MQNMSPLGSGGTMSRAQDRSIDGLRYLSNSVSRNKQPILMPNGIEDRARRYTSIVDYIRFQLDRSLF